MGEHSFNLLRAVHHGTLFDKTCLTFALCVHLVIIGYSKLFLTTGVSDIVAYSPSALCVCLYEYRRHTYILEVCENSNESPHCAS